jgi:hypothetical protein
VIASLVGVGQRAARRRVTDAKMITTRRERTQASDGFTQTRSAGKLREDHAEQLIHAGKIQRPFAGAMALVLIGAVADFAEPVEEYSAAERILLLTLVEADVATTTQLGVLQPLERKESPFQLSQFA